jgi:PAS domain S-box-containing protein
LGVHIGAVNILLLVDKNSKTTNIKNKLESFGYRVPYVTASAREAVAKALEILPDIILMDITRKAEIETINTFTKISESNIPIIYLNTHSQDSEIGLLNQINHYRYIIQAHKSSELKYALDVALHRNTIEKILNGDEKQYTDTLNNITEGLTILAPEGGFIYVNKIFEDMIGYKKEELIGHNIQEFIDNHELPLMEEAMKKIQNDETFEIQIKFIKKDGSILWTIAKHSPLYEDTEKSNPSIVLHTNITKLKKAEKELEFASLYNRSLIEASLDPLVTIGPDGKVTDANSATEKVTGCSKEEIIGSNFSNYFTEPEKADEGYKKVFKEGFVKDYPLEIQHKNGTKTPVLYNASVYKDETGKIMGVFAAARDISQLIQAEKNNQLLANVVESTDDAIIVKSLEGIILNWNNAAEQIYGYSAQEVIGKNISIITPGHLNNEISSLIEKIKKSEKIKHYETIRLKKDGTTIYVSITLSPVFDNSGNLIAISTIARDITESKKIEKELELASLYNRSLIEASLDPLVTIGPDGKVTDANSATEKVTGSSKEEIIGSNFSNYFTEPEKADEGYKKVFKEGFVKDYPLEIQHKNGTKTPVLYNASVYKDETGKIIGVFAAARDITEYKKFMTALEESEKKYREIYEESFDGLFITSPNGKILDMNKKGIEMFGYNSKEEILQLDLLKDVYDDPADRTRILKLVNKHGSAEYEVVVKKKNKKKMITQCSLTATKKNGVITSYRGIIRDITQAKNAENAIIRAKEEWENTFNAVPDLIVILDTNFKVIRANKAMADKFNITPEEMVGLTCYETVHGTNSTPTFCPFSKLLLDGHEHTSEIHEDNLGGDFVVSVSPLHDNNGNLIGVVHVARDITERKKIEIKIKNSLDEKEVLLREIHHRVKNNLQIIASLLNLQEINDNQCADNVLKESMGRVKTMATIHEKLYGSPSLSEINFKEFTEKLVYDILYSYGKSMIKTNLIIENINLNIDTAMPLGLIINELVTNSVKYAFPNLNGTITIKLNSSQQDIELIIADNGIGLSKDFNIEDVDSLGLELVKNLVNQLEGNLKVNGTNGTEFKISFQEVKYKKRL